MGPQGNEDGVWCDIWQRGTGSYIIALGPASVPFPRLAGSDEVICLGPEAPAGVACCSGFPAVIFTDLWLWLTVFRRVLSYL